MSKDEKRVLKALVEDRTGIMTPSDLIGDVAKRNRRLVENLVVKGYIEEIPQTYNPWPGLPGSTLRTITCYRATHKGLMVFNSWYEKAWFALRGDLRTIIVSVITAAITSLVALLLQGILK